MSPEALACIVVFVLVLLWREHNIHTCSRLNRDQADEIACLRRQLEHYEERE